MYSHIHTKRNIGDECEIAIWRAVICCIVVLNDIMRQTSTARYIPVVSFAVRGEEVSSMITSLSFGPESRAHTVTVESPSITEYSLCCNDSTVPLVRE